MTRPRAYYWWETDEDRRDAELGLPEPLVSLERQRALRRDTALARHQAAVAQRRAEQAFAAAYADAAHAFGDVS